MIQHFSGHDSFFCKQFWLKKGYDFVSEENLFSDERAVVELGVGRNMVSSVQYWLKCFGITDEKNKLTDIAHYLFNDQTGKDKYIENITTVWLLHYLLIKTDYATLYSVFFNEFRRHRIEFSKEHLLSFIEKRQSNLGAPFNSNTVGNDIAVFIRSYIKPFSRSNREGVEEDFSSILVDLQLIEQIDGKDFEGKKVDYFKVESELRNEIPSALILFSILDARPNSKSISFKDLLVGKDMPGSVYAMSKEGLYNKLQQISEDFHKAGVTFKETAGVQELQFNKPLNKIQILNGCY